MSAAAETIDLSLLDVYQPAELEPAVWSANLAALAAVQPALADEVRNVSLPVTWRPAIALDGFLTHRLEAPGDPAAWLGGTAAPLIRARSLLSRLESGSSNPALPCCGAGAELQLLLVALPRHVAVYVFESDLTVLAAVLRTVDVSRAFRTWRCILVPPGREAEFLAELAGTHVGLQPPGEIVFPDLVPRVRLEVLRTIGETVNRDTAARRNQRVAELQSAKPPAAAADVRGTPRLAVVALAPHVLAQGAAGCVVRASRALGWETLVCTLEDPRDVHPLVHCERLVQFRPDVTIFTNHPPALLPLAPGGMLCTWLLDEQAAGGLAPESGVHYLAASPRSASAARQAGVPAEALTEWYWAAEAARPDDARPTDQEAVLVIADVPDPNPEGLGLRHASHQRLWEHVRREVVRHGEHARLPHPERLLANAERACEIPLRDAEWRTRMLTLIERVLIPAVALERAAALLALESRSVHTVGRGWERLAQRGFSTAATHIFEWLDSGPGLKPRLCVVAAATDPLNPALLHAAANGWPLLVYEPLGVQVPDFGEVLRPGTDFQVVEHLEAFKEALTTMRAPSPADRARTERALRHVADGHTWARRLAALAARWAQTRADGTR